MKIQTSELTGAALDWAVAKCAWEPDRVFLYGEPVKHVRVANCPDISHEYNLSIYYTPSTDWAQGGPIIEREHISIEATRVGGLGDRWMATDTGDCTQFAEAPLVAAMQCYVASKLGKEVDVPEGVTA